MCMFWFVMVLGFGAHICHVLRPVTLHSSKGGRWEFVTGKRP